MTGPDKFPLSIASENLIRISVLATASAYRILAFEPTTNLF
jgi:hypothetical protein